MNAFAKASAQELDKYSSCTMFVHEQMRGSEQKAALLQAENKTKPGVDTGVHSVVRADTQARTPVS